MSNPATPRRYNPLIRRPSTIPMVTVVSLETVQTSINRYAQYQSSIDNLLPDGAAITNMTLSESKPPVKKLTDGSQQQIDYYNAKLMYETRKQRKKVQQEESARERSVFLINQTSGDHLTVASAGDLESLKKSFNKMPSLKSTMTDLVTAYMKPFDSKSGGDQFVNSPGESLQPNQLEEVQRTLLHLICEQGVSFKVTEFIENECEGNPEKIKRHIELQGDEKEGNRPLHLAAKHDHAEIIKILIGLGAYVDSVNRLNDTPLIFAVKNGNLKCVKVLTENGASASARGNKGQTAFHWACLKGQPAICRFLLQNEQPEDVARIIEAKDFTEDGNSSFHLAALGNNIDVAELIIEYLPSVMDSKNAAQFSAFHLAAFEGKLEIVKWLVDEKGVNVEERGWSDQRALHKAAEAGRIEVIRFLLASGADIEAVEGQFGGTPLHIAVMYGQVSAVKLLLEQGADITAETAIFGFESIHVAAFYGQNEVIEFLLNLGNSYIDAKALIGRTPLQLAASNGFMQTVEFLVENGCNIEEKDDQLGGTALHFSSWFGHIPIIEFLLKSGAERNSRDKAGDTPLHWACLASQPKGVAYLLTRGVNTNAKDDRIGRTALHDASAKGFQEIVQLLLTRADILATDEENGATALHLATWFGQVKVAEILLNHRAMTGVKDSSGFTALHWAVLNDKVECLHFLLDRGAKINKKGGKYGRTPLCMAAEWGRREIAEVLINRGADKEMADDNKKYRPLHMAARFKHPELVELLLSKKVNAFVRDNFGHTALHLAVFAGKSASEMDLRKWREADLKAKAGLGGTRNLEDAVSAGRWEMTEDLLRNKILNQNHVADEDSQRQINVINLLLDNCPELLTVTTSKFARTVLHVASQAGQLVATQALMERGANANARDRTGKTPLRLAFDNSKYDVVRFFVKLGIVQ